MYKETYARRAWSLFHNHNYQGGTGSHFSTIAKVHKCVNPVYHLSAVTDTKLMGAIGNVQGIVIVNMSLYWTSYSYRLQCSLSLYQ